MDQNLEQEADAGQNNINNNVNNNNMNNNNENQVDEIGDANNGLDSDGDDDWTDVEFIEFWRQHVNPDFNQDGLNELLQQYNVNNANELMQIHPFFIEQQQGEEGSDDSDSDDGGNEEVDMINNNDDDSDDDSEG